MYTESPLDLQISSYARKKEEESTMMRQQINPPSKFCDGPSKIILLAIINTKNIIEEEVTKSFTSSTLKL